MALVGWLEVNEGQHAAGHSSTYLIKSVSLPQEVTRWPQHLPRSQLTVEKEGKVRGSWH